MKHHGDLVPLPIPGTSPRATDVLTGAVLRAADMLGLTDADLAQIIGVSAPTISRCRRGRAGINPDRKAGEMALLLIRLLRALDPLVGSDPTARRLWMHSENHALRGVPAEVIRRADGLVRTLAYLDGLLAPA